MITLVLVVVLFVVIAVRLLLAFFHALPDGLGYRDEGNGVTPSKPLTRLYMWRVHVKGMPRGFKIREVPWDGREP